MLKKLMSILLVTTMFCQATALAADDISHLTPPEQRELYKQGYCAGERIPSSGYETTLQGMAARKLYSYGIVAGASDGDVDDALFNLSNPLTWPMAFTLLARMAPDYDGSSCPTTLPSGTPSWAAASYGYFAARDLLPAEASMSEPVLAEQFEDLTLTFLNTIVKDAPTTLVHPAVSAGALTRGDAFLIMSMALDIILDNAPRDTAPTLTANTEFTLPETLYLSATDLDNAFDQLDEAFRFAPERVVISAPKDTAESLLIWTNGSRATTELAYKKHLLFSKHFARYSMNLRAIPGTEPNTTSINCTFASYEIATYLRADSQSWLKCFKDSTLSSSYRDFIQQDILPLTTKYGDDTYSLLKAVAERICDTAVYDNDFYSGIDWLNDYHDIPGYLRDGKIVCDGYAHLFKACLFELGFPCLAIDGTASGVNHTWNKILLDGKWYNADICWMDTMRSGSTYFLRSDYFFRSNSHESWSTHLSPLYAALNDYIP